MIPHSKLREATQIDFATVELGYETFRALAQNQHLSENGRIGFPDSYRNGSEEAIVEDILKKLPALAQGTAKTIVDIGPGCARLPRMLIDWCAGRGHRLILVDSPEMLVQLPDVLGTTIKIEGRFPTNLSEILEAAGADGADVVLCYSVMHYLYREANIFDVMDASVQMLAEGGSALFGDIPNESKRRRFFASRSGKDFHRKFTGSASDPKVEFNLPCRGKIDDSVLAGCVARVQQAGCDAYIVPQPNSLPMANRRDDLLIVKP